MVVEPPHCGGEVDEAMQEQASPWDTTLAAKESFPMRGEELPLGSSAQP